MSHRRAISESWRTCEAIPARHRSSGDTSYLCRCTQVSTAAGYRHTSGEVALRMNWCTCMQGSSCGNQRPSASFHRPSAPICANLRPSKPSAEVRLACAPAPFAPRRPKASSPRRARARIRQGPSNPPRSNLLRGGPIASEIASRSTRGESAIRPSSARGQAPY